VHKHADEIDPRLLGDILNQHKMFITSLCKKCLWCYMFLVGILLWFKYLSDCNTTTSNNNINCGNNNTSNNKINSGNNNNSSKNNNNNNSSDSNNNSNAFPKSALLLMELIDWRLRLLLAISLVKIGRYEFKIQILPFYFSSTKLLTEIASNGIFSLECTAVLRYPRTFYLEIRLFT